jgi:hypothetical protein
MPGIRKESTMSEKRIVVLKDETPEEEFARKHPFLRTFLVLLINLTTQTIIILILFRLVIWWGWI